MNEGTRRIELRDTSTLEVHPEARLVPDMRPSEYAALREDIRLRGIVTPLEVLGDVVLDGRHRLRVARELGLDTVPTVEPTLGRETRTSYMLKAALLRRHLTDDQRAVIAALHAKQHPRKTGRSRKQRPTGGAVSARPRRVKNPARVERATTVLRADPNIAEDVRQGRIKLNAARQGPNPVRAPVGREPSRTDSIPRRGHRAPDSRAHHRVGSVGLNKNAATVGKHDRRLQ